MHTIEELERLIQDADRKYWELGAPDISDFDYDALVEELRSLAPDHPLVNRVNAAYAPGEKITHTKPMLSLGKVYGKAAMKDWMVKVSRSFDEQFYVQPKYDGISGKLERGILVTRGDGLVGVNITDKLPIIKIESEKKDGILGEIVIKDSDFAGVYKRIFTKQGTPFKNSRNAVAGIVGTDDVSFYAKQGAVLTLVDYDLNKCPVNLMEFDDKWESVCEKLQALDYPMDGIVVKLADSAYADSLGSTEHHPRGAMAFKFTNRSVESVVQGFTLTIGKRGTLAATAQIEPRDIGGVTVSNVKVPVFETVDGQPGIADGGIRVGSRVRVERAGDVIPYLAEVLEQGEGEVANVDSCPVCGGKLYRDGANLYCRNPECGEQKLNKLYFSVATLGMFGIGKEIVRSIMENVGVQDLLGFMQLTYTDLFSLEGFGDTKIKNVLGEIEKARDAEEKQFLTALNIPELGGKASELLLEKFSLDDICEGRVSQAQMLQVNGIGEVMAEKICNGLAENREWIAELRKQFRLKKSEKTPASESKGTVCFTGKSSRTRSEMQKVAAEKGYTPVDSVSKDLTILVCADMNSTSSKMLKAQKLGVRVMSEEEFWGL